MDLHRVLLKRNQKANMGPFIPQNYAELALPQFEGKAPFQALSQSCGSIPYKAFTCPRNLSNFAFIPENLMNKAVYLTRGMHKTEKSPAMNLTCIVGGFVDGRQGAWNPRESNCFNNPLDMISQIVNKSIEITQTVTCPDLFNFGNFVPSKTSPVRETPPASNTPVVLTPAPKLSYADVTKINLSNINKNSSTSCKPVAIVNDSSSQKIQVKPCARKVISSPRPYKASNAKAYKRTDSFNETDKNCAKAKHPFVQRNANFRKQQHNKRVHPSLKRELGTKKNNQKMDFDGSIWGQDNSEVESECSPAYQECSPAPSRVRSISSDSECSSELSECLRNPRVRSISECSVNSVDSEDSFIVFDDCTDDREEESYEETTSSEDEDEYESRSCDGETQADYLQSVNSKWNTLHSKPVSTHQQADNICSSMFPCQALKQVRFACGEALAKVRKLCVWDYAHRAARIGPWEQAARDRDRFAKRISLLAPVLNPVLDSTHRNKIYNLHFAP